MKRWPMFSLGVVAAIALLFVIGHFFPYNPPLVPSVVHEGHLEGELVIIKMANGSEVTAVYNARPNMWFEVTPCWRDHWRIHDVEYREADETWAVLV